MTGLRAYRSGRAAEEAVERTYLARGAIVLARRWRTSAGEIDLVFELGGVLIFVEVKKGRDFASAAARLSPDQRARIVAVASAYLADQPKGQDTECRFDAALVDSAGRVEIIENAFS